MSATTLLHRTVRAVSWPLIRRHVTRRLAGVAGLEHLPATGGAVITPNHRSYYDHFVMLTLLRQVRGGQPIWFVTKSEAFERPLSRIWHESWHSIPVDRSGPTPEVLRVIRDRLSAGELVVIYPEGTRNDTPELLEFKSGAYRFAAMAQAPVVPVGMSGTDVVLPRGSTRSRSGEVRVAVGPPLVAAGEGRRARSLDLLARGRVAVAALIANTQRAAFDPDSTAGTVAAVDDAIAAGLDSSGRLASPAVRHHRRVLRVARTVAGPDPDLDVQRIRLAGLQATNHKGLARLATALPLGRRLSAVRRANPEHPLAAYLLARWQLMVPRRLGGGAVRARTTFADAARLLPRGDTRALSGLAEAHLALGDAPGARRALEELLARTDPAGRGAARIERARAALASIEQGVA